MFITRVRAHTLTLTRTHIPAYTHTRRTPTHMQGKEAFVGLAEADIQAMSNGGGTQRSRL
jgi:hypothetical protein